MSRYRASTRVRRTSRRWSPIALHPTAIMDNAADQIDGIVYSVGGFNGIGEHPQRVRLRPDRQQWSPIADMPAAREKPGAGAIGGKLYVLGRLGYARRPGACTPSPTTPGRLLETVAPNPAPRAAAGHGRRRRQAVPGRRLRGRRPARVEQRRSLRRGGDTWETPRSVPAHHLLAVSAAGSTARCTAPAASTPARSTPTGSSTTRPPTRGRRSRPCPSTCGARRTRPPTACWWSAAV